ncbi:MAG TPA: hypothetical protein VHV10_05055 [Ktedonobacteraceae bacterium]|jgi:hypothetical protein|nr:hypothetical protein [Ktedonobacteraceae bacterium]
MPFYAPGGLKIYIQAILQEGLDFETELPINFPRNLESLEELRVIHSAMIKKQKEVSNLYNYLILIIDSHNRGEYIGSVIEYILSTKHIQAVKEYLGKLQLWTKELEDRIRILKSM